ncbi:MAG TPA: carbonic anhydrase [Terriglobales bacterium]|nr:carbonic anhydrase [Terriglobales bacterium]
MSTIDEVVLANEKYAQTHKSHRLSPRPTRKLAVVTCMDTRLTKATLGLADGDAHIIRNAGGIITDDTLRSLLVSHYSLGTQEFMIINHTDCGLMRSTEEELRTMIERQAGTASISPERFYAFKSPEENARKQLEKLKSHPWVRKEIVVRGFVFDVETGRLKEVFV